MPFHIITPDMLSGRFDSIVRKVYSCMESEGILGKVIIKSTQLSEEWVSNEKWNKEILSTYY